MERRLAAILAADVVAYTSLMEADEEGTFAALKERRRLAIEPTIQQYGGHIFKLTGDGALIELPSIVAAVECAIAIQRSNESQNVEQPPDRHIRLRIGITIGDVMVEDGDIYGTGVNIAARLEGLAPPGGICISGAAVDQVQGRNGLSFRYIGRKELKHISEPIAVYEVEMDKAPGTSPSRAAALAPVTERPSLAVLPFENLGGEGLKGYFSDGITRDLITELSRFRSMFVISANSSFKFRNARES